VIAFRDLPHDKMLRLTVYESPRNCRPCTLLRKRRRFRTRGGVGNPLVAITSPVTGATVSTTFSACGTSTVAGTVTADLEGPDGSYPGTVLTGPSYWSVQFSSVKAGQHYTLYVNVGRQEAQPSQNITVH
jgi:hypothetical protein